MHLDPEEFFRRKGPGGRKRRPKTWLGASCNHEAYNTRCFHFPRATIDIIIVWLRVLSLRRVPDCRRGSVRLPANRPISQSNLFRRPALDAIQPANQIDLNGSINQAHLSSRPIPPWPLRRRSDRESFSLRVYSRHGLFNPEEIRWKVEFEVSLNGNWGIY